MSGGADNRRMCVSCKDDAIEIVADCLGSASETRSKAARPVHYLLCLSPPQISTYAVLAALSDPCLIIAELYGCSRDPHF